MAWLYFLTMPVHACLLLYTWFFCFGAILWLLLCYFVLDWLVGWEFAVWGEQTGVHLPAASLFLPLARKKRLL